MADTEMKRFLVTSGDLDEIIEAESCEAAVDSAIQKGLVDGVKLGKFTGVVEVIGNQTFTPTKQVFSRLEEKGILRWHNGGDTSGGSMR